LEGFELKNENRGCLRETNWIYIYIYIYIEDVLA